MKQLLSDAMDDYANLRRSQDYSKRTLNNEGGILRRFLAISGNIWVHNISERHVIRYLEEASKTRQPNTLQLDHSTLSQFFDWARRSKRMSMSTDPMAFIRRPKMTKKERNRLHVGQFAHLLDTAGTDDPRNRAVIAVLLYLLIRDQEAADLRVGDVDLDGGYITVRVTKSHQEDRMPICAELDAELRLWLTKYSEAVGTLRPNYYLLPRRKSVGLLLENNRISGHEMVFLPTEKVSRLGSVVRPILEKAGFPVRDHAGRAAGEGAHTLRRSGARALFDRLCEEGYDHSLRIVQSMLHHASVSQTELYLGLSADRKSRDEILRGHSMFATESDNLVRLTV